MDGMNCIFLEFTTYTFIQLNFFEIYILVQCIIILLFTLCAEQRYIPLKTSEFEEVKVSEDVNKETVSVSVSWYRLDNKDVGYIVAMGDEECTIPNRYPPCVIVKNGVSLISLCVCMIVFIYEILVL